MTVAERRRAATRAEILDEAWELCRAHGLAGLSLRELATHVGMAAPSLYSYFDSKDAIYDAMFRAGYEQLRELGAAELVAGTHPREVLRHGARQFFEFCTADPARYQLLFQRTIPGFEPSPESYEIAVEVLESARAGLHEVGITDAALLDLWTALLTGLTDQQISNDPGGQRWGHLVDRAVDMFADHAGIPASEPTEHP